ncbi:MAG TPA: M48 family metallopeptidase [Pseudolabrys sp.]|nr:M48 family metallopeptidase [Pseudolabrys sp.]
MNAGASGEALYFDGVTSARHDVRVELGDTSLQIFGRDGSLMSEWPYPEVEELAASEAILRIGRRGSTRLERLEIHDPVFAEQIDLRSALVDRTGIIHRRARMSVIAWTLGATISLVLVAWLGIPAIATRLTPLVPPGIERRLGEAVDVQIRGMLDNGQAGADFDCGKTSTGARGRVALDKIVRRLEAAAALPFPLRAEVVRREEANAVALPGGRIYVFQGLIDKADTADEVAGVIAHEIGHVANRDGTRAVLQGAGLSFLFGMLLGDFVGGGAVVLAARTLLQLSYTREAETAADAYGAGLMNAAGGDARALAVMLEKIGGATEPGMKILLNHPETAARVAAINKLALARKASPFLDAEDWVALKKICAG